MKEPSALRIVSRKSPLAMRQAELVKSQLQARYPELNLTIIGVSTTGDNLVDIPLTKLGGKGLFTKELEVYLMNHEADLAVHSMKDVPVTLPEGLEIPVLLAREDPREAFLSNRYPSLDALPEGAVIGTSSLRRQLQIQRLRPDLGFLPLRGNVDTRIKKLDDNHYDAIILALAGLKRLGLEHRATALFDCETLLPAIGQGALGLECRVDDWRTKALLAPLNDEATAAAVLAERTMNALLGGSCESPIGGWASISAISPGSEFLNSNLTLIGRVFSLNTPLVLEANCSDRLQSASILGETVAKQLLLQGAKDIIEENLLKAKEA